VVASADDLGASEKQADLPAFVLVGTALKTDAGDLFKRIEQFGHVDDESVQPVGAQIALTAFLFPLIELRDEMRDGQVRVVHGDPSEANTSKVCIVRTRRDHRS